MIITLWFHDDTPEVIQQLITSVNRVWRDKVSIATSVASELNIALYEVNRGAKALYAGNDFARQGFYPVNPAYSGLKKQLIKLVPQYAKLTLEEREHCLWLFASVFGLEGMNGPKHVRSRFVVTCGQTDTFSNKLIELCTLWNIRVIDLRRKEHRAVLMTIVKQLQRKSDELTL